MAISEKKMQIVMNNYFKAECTVNTSIREAFEKGFRIGVQKGYDVTKEPERKNGEWKPFDLTWGRSVYSCTACGEAMDIPTEMSKPIYSFCPNCGAKMEWSDYE